MAILHLHWTLFTWPKDGADINLQGYTLQQTGWGPTQATPPSSFQQPVSLSLCLHPSWQCCLKQETEKCQGINTSLGLTAAWPLGSSFILLPEFPFGYNSRNPGWSLLLAENTLWWLLVFSVSLPFQINYRHIDPNSCLNVASCDIQIKTHSQICLCCNRAPGTDQRQMSLKQAEFSLHSLRFY